ncbi:MAG: hypothetical protein HOE11_01805 [Candidatus Diapherotrites archaeon]|jgi:hypothetical protein|nr:hypothetical protein [Candidatus Diapherotrites archaeon]MBT4597050.1 hypothetical protein [Candidatus Diapherotrites archaeon]
MDYDHTQTGYLIIIALILVALLFGFIFTQIEFHYALLVLMIAILLLLTSFLTLNVTVNKNYLRIKFGYGIFSKSFKIKEITSVKAVRNKWYYGWGIRFWWKPRMIIYNVSGYDAVEIKLKNKRIYRIGTDEPKQLEQAIKKRMS